MSWKWAALMKGSAATFSPTCFMTAQERAPELALAPEPFPPGVDTPEDLERAQARLDGGNR